MLSLIAAVAMCDVLASLSPAAAHAADEPRALLIAPPGLLPAATEYARQRSQQDQSFSMSAVSLADALAQGHGRDDAEKLKTYLFQQWKHGVRSVLLVGDADVLPVRYMVLDRVTPPAFDYAFYPSDLYYADVARPDGSFDDWNASAQGFHAEYFGEVRGEKNKSDPINFDLVSYSPELCVGRWPVSTAGQVRAIAAKSLAYESAARKSAIELRAVGVVTGNWVDVRSRFDRMLIALPRGWAFERMYYRDGAWGGYAPEESRIVGELAGGASLVVHAGHGDEHVWEGCLSTRAVPEMTNDRFGGAIMVSAGCSTGRFAGCPPYEAYEDISGTRHAGTNSGEVFSQPPPPPSCYTKGEFNHSGLGQELLRAERGGAVVYIGCNTGSQPCGVTLVEEFVREMGRIQENEHPTLGDCWTAAVRNYLVRERVHDLKPDDGWYPPSIFYQPMKFMFFGDPTLPVARSAPR